ncbi:helix-turn-helix domain-containing protein [Paenibacillus chibensis]|uniref:helix-turn-helix domain-containing protein n=1 Tax=Paenibacillus chibensis TaxID=59846 RepID=UPI000FDB29EE|nr:helix-turn-helix transcriptional regulator [Paenibacillus chibensis]MEC0373565.1 helix-turn-helix transcriptional regulator [Paenibacillus chibensis]
MEYIKLGRRLREERLKLNLTQEKLAEKIDVSEAYIGQIERGERSLSLETLVKLVNQLGITVDFLLQDSVKLDDEHFIDHMRQLVMGRNIKEKQMVLDMAKLLLSHLDDIKS